MWGVSRSVSQYVEAQMFFILEELRYVIVEATRLLCTLYGVSIDGKKAERDPDASSRSKHEFETTKGTVSLVGEDGGDFIHVRMDKAGLTPYKWNEAVVLISSCDLNTAETPVLFYGVSNCGGAGADASETLGKKEITLYVHMSEAAKRVIHVGRVLFFYSLSPFTSYSR